MFKLVILFQFTSNTTSSFMNPDPAKLAEGGITGYTLSGNSTRKLVFYCNLSSIFTTEHHSYLLKIYSQHLYSNALFQAFSLSFRYSGVSLMPIHQQRAVLTEILT